MNEQNNTISIDHVLIELQALTDALKLEGYDAGSVVPLKAAEDILKKNRHEFPEDTKGLLIETADKMRATFLLFALTAFVEIHKASIHVTDMVSTYATFGATIVAFLKEGMGMINDMPVSQVDVRKALENLQKFSSKLRQ